MLITTQRSSLSPWLPSPLALKCCPRCPRSLSSSHAPTLSSGEYRHSHTRKESRRTPTTTVPLPTDIVTFRTTLPCWETNTESATFPLTSCHQLGMGVAEAMLRLTRTRSNGLQNLARERSRWQVRVGHNQWYRHNFWRKLILEFKG